MSIPFLKSRYFLIKDLNYVIELVKVKRRKYLLECMDEYLENWEHTNFDRSNDCFQILYEDGSEDRINEDYDGHKIKRQHITSMVWINGDCDMVFGDFELNEYANAYPAFKEKIAEHNIIEIEEGG